MACFKIVKSNESPTERKYNKKAIAVNEKSFKSKATCKSSKAKENYGEGSSEGLKSQGD